MDPKVEKAIDKLLDAWDLDTLLDYAREQLLAWAETADQEEIDHLLEQAEDIR